MKVFKYKPAINMTSQQAKVYQDNWNLSEEERERLDSYELRHWMASELADNIAFPTNSDIRVRLWNREFLPVFTGSKETWQRIMYLAVRDKAESAEDLKHTKQPMYWLSFRSGLVEGKRFSYVIIQEDRK